MLNAGVWRFLKTVNDNPFCICLHCVAGFFWERVCFYLCTVKARHNKSLKYFFFCRHGKVKLRSLNILVIQLHKEKFSSQHLAFWFQVCYFVVYFACTFFCLFYFSKGGIWENIAIFRVTLPCSKMTHEFLSVLVSPLLQLIFLGKQAWSFCWEIGGL